MDKLRNLFGKQKPAEDETLPPPGLSNAPMAAEEPEPPVEVMPVGATRQLPSLESALIRPNTAVTFGYGRDVGMLRDNNEDAVSTFFSSQRSASEMPDFGVFILADGAGGHESGEFASAIVSNVLLEQITSRIFHPMLSQPASNAGADMTPTSEILAEAVNMADEAIKEEVPGGGTTLTAAVLIGSLVHIAHVGDSRAYLLRGEPSGSAPHLDLLTRDHSVAKRLEEIGQITADEASSHPEASKLWKLMGLTENLQPDIITRQLPSNCQVLICSDGLWNMVPDHEIMAILLDALDPQEAVDRLIAAANAHGGLDNISCIVLRIP